MGPRVAWKTGADYVPKQGNRELAISYDFSVNASYLDDLLPELTSGQIEFVQSVFIDNSANLNPLLIQFLQGPQQPIQAPAQSQGYYNVTMGGDVRYKISTTPAAALNVKLIFSNVKREQQTWGPITVNVAGVTAVFTPEIANITTSSFTLTGGDDVILAANPARKRLRFQAAFGNAAPFAINYGAAAVLASNVNYTAGQEPYDSGSGPVTPQAIHAKGTAGDIVNIEES